MLMWFGILLFDQGVRPDGSTDNAPSRAAAGLFFLAPFYSIILFFLILAISFVLRLFRIVTKEIMILMVLIYCLLGATFFAIDGYQRFGVDDGLITFAVFFAFFLVSSGPGAFAWWYAYHKEN